MRRRNLAIWLATLLVGSALVFGLSIGAAFAAAGSVTPAGAALRQQANETAQAVSMEDPQFWAGTGLTPYNQATGTGTGAAKRMELPCTLSSGSGALNVGTAVNTTATVTVGQYQRLLTVGSPIFTYSQVGEPITVSGLGNPHTNGGVLSTKIDGYFSSTSVMLHDPVQQAQAGTTETIGVGNVFTAADVGKLIYIGYHGQTANGVGTAGAVYSGTITGSADSADVTISPVAGAACPAATSGSIWMQFTWGADASAAANAAVQTAAQPPSGFGLRRVTVNGSYLVPGLNAEAAEVNLRGDGAFYFSPFAVNIVPPWAGPVHPPTATVQARNLTNLASSPAPTMLVAGDSRWVDNSPGAQFSHFTPAQFDFAMTAANVGRGIAPALRYAIGGSTCVQLDTHEAAYASYFNAANNTPWISGIIQPLKPNLVVVGCGINDALLAFPTNNWLDLMRQFQADAPPSDVIVDVPYPKGTTYGFSGTGTPACSVQYLCDWNWDDEAAFERSYAKVYGLGYIDMARRDRQVRSGYDPTSAHLTRWPYVNASGGSTGMQTLIPTGLYSWIPQFSTQHYSVEAGNINLSPATFFADMGEIQHQIGYPGDNIFRIGEIPSGVTVGTAGDLYIECDISAGAPGAGCRNNAVPSAVPVAPLPLSAVTISASSNALSTSVSMFTSGMENKQLVVPGASALVYGPSNAYTDYLRCSNGNVPFIHYISATSVTLFTDATQGTACTAGSALPAVSEILWTGEPWIDTGINVSSDPSTSTYYYLDAVGDELHFSWLGFWKIPHDGPVVRFYGAPFAPFIHRTANVSNLVIQNDASTGTQPALFVGTTDYVLPSLFDEEVFGNPYWTGDNTEVLANRSGNNDAHESTLWTDAIARPVLAALDLALGPQVRTRTYTATADGTICQGMASATCSLPPNSRITGIYLTETAGGSPTGGVQIGTSARGSQVVGATTVNASSSTTINPGSLLEQALGGQTLYISAVGGSGDWNGASINVDVEYVRTQ